MHWHQKILYRCYKLLIRYHYEYISLIYFYQYRVSTRTITILILLLVVVKVFKSSYYFHFRLCMYLYAIRMRIILEYSPNKTRQFVILSLGNKLHPVSRVIVMIAAMLIRQLESCKCKVATDVESRDPESSGNCCASIRTRSSQPLR